ncbi:FHA domain-containing protein [Parahaliea aestuarii]|uniref:FHA domain-containing protein n=1 Tax=Parahaliea aestuarii TaxID=1852021 RepID=A0A5C8ZN27_9GAMM|nr:FHA domain-containing protein [Parahaliea aestuarii]TXS89140.1 FHA domain-containing protein [Parahaliea aestuarii]
MANGLNSFFRELKRRKVLRTCVLYVVLCWGALQVGDILFPALGIDDELASRYLLVGAVLGFPLTFALAWFFQITPQGIVKTPSFVERRVLSNIKPINDRRSKAVSTYFRRGEDHPEFHWVLSAETGPLAGLSFGVTRPITMGRALDCDVAVVSPHVSRTHARLDIESDLLFIEDLGSSNGTVVNGKVVQGRHRLHNEDEVRFHDIIFRVEERITGNRAEHDALSMTTFIDSTRSGTEGGKGPNR